MPRPNAPRHLVSEDSLARRIAYERATRGWTLDGLAKRVTDAGCPINQSAIYKIESATPRRRITVDEMVALSAVFEVPVADLLLAPEVVIDRAARELVREYLGADARVSTALKDRAEVGGRLRAHLRRHAEAQAQIGQEMPPGWMDLLLDDWDVNGRLDGIRARAYVVEAPEDESAKGPGREGG